jgi:hypothetical protein
MMGKPKNVVWVVADSVRYDSVFRPGEPSGLDYALAHGTHFTQARSAGCWTLPATASMFTGLAPHRHGADTHHRSLRGVETLAARLTSLGYAAYQVTANVVTTQIFGLHGGFDRVFRAWDDTKLRWADVGLHEALVIGAKPRLRKALLNRDVVSEGFMKDLSASKVWLHSTADGQFAEARRLLREHNERGRGVFLFINLMEGHFPYHIGDDFALLSGGLVGKARELAGLFHFCNQTRLTTGREHVPAGVLATLRERQRRAWLRLAPKIDAFVRHVREGGAPSTVLVCSDHGDNFGDAGWEYHFSNVTEAGNRVPLVWLRSGDDAPRRVDAPVSTRDLFGSVLAECGAPGFHLADEPERSVVTTESYWYSNHGKTLDRFKQDQFSFVAGGRRFVHRGGAWYVAPLAGEEGGEPALAPLGGADPIEDACPDAERRAAVREAFRGFRCYAGRRGQSPGGA